MSEGQPISPMLENNFSIFQERTASALPPLCFEAFPPFWWPNFPPNTTNLTRTGAMELRHFSWRHHTDTVPDEDEQTLNWPVVYCCPSGINLPPPGSKWSLRAALMASPSAVM